MSRGIGWVQKAALKVLEQQKRCDSITIAALVYDVQPDDDGNCYVTDSQAASVRRALGLLQKSGKAFMTHRTPLGRGCWMRREVALADAQRLRRTFPDMRLPQALDDALGAADAD